MKRMTALLMAVMMIVSMMPTIALAAADAPQNPRWYQGAYLMAEWDPPADDQGYYLYDIVIYYSENGDGSWTYIDYYDDWEKGTGYAIDGSYVARYGNGYYKFKVRCSDKSCNGESDWVESAPYYLNLANCTKTRISAPLAGSFDPVSGALSWSDSEDVDSDFYRHNAVVEMWYTGENGELPEAQWTMVKRGTVGGFTVTGTDMSDFVYASDLRKMESGCYVFTVQNLAEDYCWRGMSEAILLEGTYEHTKVELEALDAPTGLAWTDEGVLWDNPVDLGLEVGNLGGYTIEFIRAESEEDDPSTGTVLDSMSFGVSAEMLEAGYWNEILMEMGYMCQEIIRNSAKNDGAAWFYFRVKADADNSDLNNDSVWAYSDALYNDGSLPSAGEVTDLQWNVYRQGNENANIAGNIAFYAENGGKFELKLYYSDNYYEELVGTNEGYLSEGWNNFDFFSDNPGLCRTGSYYYTIQLMGDDQSTSDGKLLRSENWDYTCPEKSLTAANLKWNMDERKLSFDLEKELVSNVSVRYYFNPTEDNPEEAQRLDTYKYQGENLPITFDTDLLSENGEGYYYYKVATASKDITQAVGSDWSGDFSEPYYFAKPTRTLALYNPSWNTDGSLTWAHDGPNATDLIGSYEVRFYYKDSADVLPDPAVDNYIETQRYFPDGTSDIPTGMLLEYGTGYYYYTIRPISKDPLVANTGNWTGLSTPFYYEKSNLVLSVSNPGWDGDTLTWTPNFDSNAPVAYYQIRFYYGKTEASLAASAYLRRYTVDPSALPWSLPMDLIRTYGVGYYAYDVRVISSDEAFAASGDWSARSTTFHYEGPSVKAPAATDLQWHLYRNSSGNNSYEEYGTVSFCTSEPITTNGMEYDIDFYRKDAAGDVHVGEAYGWINRNRFCDSIPFFDSVDPEKLLDGVYYFTVTAKGDGVTCADSETVRSSDWTYTRPEIQLTVSDIQWNSDMSLHWAEDKTGLVDSYEVRFQYVAADGTFQEQDWTDYETYGANASRFTPYDQMLTAYGNGTWYFQVRALPEDHREAMASAWSDWSEGFAYTVPETQLTAQNLQWNEDGKMTWDLGNIDLSMVDSYRVYFYYSESADPVFEESNWWSWEQFSADELPAALPAWVIDNRGLGYYAFSVMAFSADKTAALGGVQSDVSPVYHFVGANTPAPQATDLQWNFYRNSKGTNSYEEYGTVSFGASAANEEMGLDYRVDFYRKDAAGDIHIGEILGWISEGRLYDSVYPFEEFPEMFTTGTYYFTVTTVGDKINYKDSEPVRSSEWKFVHPGVNLTVSDPEWNTDMSMSWSEDQTGLVKYYDVRFQYVPVGGTFYENDWHEADIYHPDYDDYIVSTDWLREYGTGTWYFQVRAVTSDLNQAISSGWSAWSEGFSYTKPSVDLTAQNLQWTENGEMTWDPIQGIEKYKVQIHYNHVNEANFGVVYSWEIVSASDLPWKLPSYIIEDLGIGYYWCSVLPISADPTKALGQWSRSAVYEYQGTGQQISTPTDLQWHQEVVYVNHEWTLTERMGSMVFKRPVDAQGNIADQAKFEYEIYCVGESDPVERGTWWTGSDSDNPWFDMNSFIYADLPSGDYWFRVRAVGDSINYKSSEWVSSDTWTYKQPATRLDTPVVTGWNDTDYTDWQDNIAISPTWEPVENVAYYEVDFFFAKNENAALQNCSGTYGITDCYTTLWDDILAEHGPGLYFYKVRAISGDITKALNGHWSDMSAAYDTREATDRVNGQLDSLLGQTGEEAKAEQIQEALSDMGLLDEAMALDAAKGTSGTLDKLAQLEEKVKTELNVETKVEVDGLSDRFENGVPQITITNMALNVDIDAASEATGTTTVTLNVSDAKNASKLPKTLIDTQKNNTMVFSMDIENAKDADTSTPSQDLMVPVQITLPIPADINRSFLVILHEKANGTWEELFMPHVFQKEGQWYATFNVTSFSNYAIGERVVTVEADDNVVTVEAHLPTCGEEIVYLCAVYSTDGQMLGMTMLEPWAEEAVEIELQNDVPAGAYVKIFAVDSGDDWTPPSEAIQIEIQ